MSLFNITFIHVTEIASRPLYNNATAQYTTLHDKEQKTTEHMTI